MLCFSKEEETSDEDDKYYEAYITVNPSSGVFFCDRERYPRSLNGEDGASPFLPLGLSWLRLERATGVPAPKGYVKLIKKVWEFKSPIIPYDIIMPECLKQPYSVLRKKTVSTVGEQKIPKYVKKQTYDAVQITDKEGPLFAPDYYNKEEKWLSLLMDKKKRRQN